MSPPQTMILFPWLAWVAAITSFVLLVVRWSVDDGSPRWWLAALTGCFLLSGYLQFFSPSEPLQVTGLVIQTLLAVLLITWWKFDL